MRCVREILERTERWEVLGMMDRENAGRAVNKDSDIIRRAQPCPKCGSQDFEEPIYKPATQDSRDWLSFECSQCGYPNCEAPKDRRQGTSAVRDDDECPKCGRSEFDGPRWAELANGVFDRTTKECLVFTCSTCGFAKTTPTLDATAAGE